MKRMIDTEKFLDKLLYMGYMDEQKSEVEEVANRMTEDAYTKEEVIAMFNDLKSEIGKTAEEVKNYDVKWALGLFFAKKIIQEKINVLKEPGDEIQC